MTNKEKLKFEINWQNLKINLDINVKTCMKKI